MNPNAVVLVSIMSDQYIVHGVVFATVIKMDTILDTLQISQRSVRNGKKMGNKLNIYTDGACSGNPGPGGWSVVWYGKGKILNRSGGSKNTTNNQMELVAVLEALKLIESKSNKITYDICSDSAYVVNAINNGWLYSWRKNDWMTQSGDPVKNAYIWQDLYVTLVSLKMHKYIISFTKVKGHSGNPLNEYADKIAKAEVVKQQLGLR